MITGRIPEVIVKSQVGDGSNDLKVLVLIGSKGWIVERITDLFIDKLPFRFTKVSYLGVSPEWLAENADAFDLIHFQNTNIGKHLCVLKKIKKPVIVTVRSHRYNDYVKGLYVELLRIPRLTVHVIDRRMLRRFPGAIYIPDGVWDWFSPPHEFTVGYAGQPTEYKGYPYIEEACRQLGVRFHPATGNVPPEKMKDYYLSIDLLVCASKDEGHGAPILEAMAMNVPVITTNVGVAREFKLVKIHRSVRSIKNGILKFSTSKQVDSKYCWETILPQMEDLYKLAFKNEYNRLQFRFYLYVIGFLEKVFYSYIRRLFVKLYKRFKNLIKA